MLRDDETPTPTHDAQVTAILNDAWSPMADRTIRSWEAIDTETVLRCLR